MQIRKSEPIWRQWNLIYNFGQRDLKTKFKGSALGWLWSLIVPLATIVIYTVVFSLIFRGAPPDMGNGHPGIFVVWLFCGLTVWTFFSSTVNSGMAALMGTGTLLQKVYFPAYAPVLGAALASGVQWGIETGILAVILLVMVNVGWTWLLVPLWAAIVILFTCGLAVAVAIVNIYYRDLAHLVAIALQLLFYMTPIIYPPSLVQDHKYGAYLWRIISLNPLTEYVELFRHLVYELTPGSYEEWGIAVAWALFAWWLGWFVMKRKGADLGEYV